VRGNYLFLKIVIGLIVLGLGISGFILREQLVASAQITRLTIELNRDPKNFDAAFGLGVAYFKTRDYTKSVEFYSKAIQINDASAEALNNLGNAYRKLLRYEDAEKSYLEVLTIAPRYTTSYINLVNLYEDWPKDKADRSVEIAELLQRGLVADPDNPTLLRELINYYKKLGDEANAQKYQDQLDGL
jgi:Tfp pilus assembly protein PilF